MGIGDEEVSVERARLTASFELVRQGQEFQSQMIGLLAENPNAGTIEGLATLAHSAQQDLYATNGLNRGESGRAVKNNNTEMGVRVVATLLDRNVISVDYEIGNLEGWLRRKSLGVEREGEREIHWSKGREGTGGQQEHGLYFKREELTLGATTSILEHLSVKCVEMAAKHVGSEKDVRVLVLAGAVAKTVSMEIRSLVATGKPISKEMYQVMLGKPLEGIGVKVVDRDKPSA